MSCIGKVSSASDDYRREMAQHEMAWDRAEAMQRFVVVDPIDTDMPRPFQQAAAQSYEQFITEINQARRDEDDKFRVAIGLPPLHHHE